MINHSKDYPVIKGWEKTFMQKERIDIADIRTADSEVQGLHNVCQILSRYFGYKENGVKEGSGFSSSSSDDIVDLVQRNVRLNVF